MVPPAQAVIEHPRFAEFDTTPLQLVLYGAAPIDDALLLQAIDKLPRAGFCQLYGMTELSPVVTVLPTWCHHPDQPAARRRSAGRPVPIAEVRIVDTEGRRVPNGTVGGIAARGPMVMAGYWNKPEQTAGCCVTADAHRRRRRDGRRRFLLTLSTAQGHDRERRREHLLGRGPNAITQCRGLDVRRGRLARRPVGRARACRVVLRAGET